MCTMGISSSSCGSLEAIAQVGVPNIAVSAKRHNAWTTSTMWWIFRTPCCLKMLPKVSNSMRRTFNIHSNSIHCHTSIKHTNGLHKFCRILGLLKIKKIEKKKLFFQHLFLNDIKVYKIRLKSLKRDIQILLACARTWKSVSVGFFCKMLSFK